MASFLGASVTLESLFTDIRLAVRIKHPSVLRSVILLSCEKLEVFHLTVRFVEIRLACLRSFLIIEIDSTVSGINGPAVRMFEIVDFNQTPRASLTVLARPDHSQSLP
jgi:hypothetical protein